MEKHSFIQLVEKYLSGSANESERQLVEEYLRKMEANGTTPINEKEEQQFKQAIWLKVTERTVGQQAKVVQGSWFQGKIVRLSAAAAAACAIIILLVWKPWVGSYDNGNLQTLAVAQGMPIQKIKLADGTLVWVKPNSKLSYPVAFAGELREIDLEGEALFEVAKDSLHPLIVHSGNIDVRVVGTSFNIRDAEGKDTVEVAVLTGRVLIDALTKPGSEKIELKPFHKLVLNKKNGELQKTGFSSADVYIAGTAYDMQFTNAPLDSILAKIERKFDVHMQINAPYGEACRISGNFTDQSLEHTMDMLCKSLGATCSIEGNTVRINSLNCK